jgi:hypothetical protein
MFSDDRSLRQGISDPVSLLGVKSRETIESIIDSGTVPRGTRDCRLVVTPDSDPGPVWIPACAGMTTGGTPVTGDCFVPRVAGFAMTIFLRPATER